MRNIWILTEEKPKMSVIRQIMDICKDDFGIDYSFGENAFIRPIGENGVFSFAYQAKGIDAKGIGNIFIKLVSGNSSFLDFMLFIQESKPTEQGKNNLVFAVEETKTSDDESRNTGVYQRCAKFVYIKMFYPDVPLYMLYNEELGLRQEKKPSDTGIFGTNMLLANGVKISGKPIAEWYKPFASIDELIDFKNGMRRPPAGNTPIIIDKTESKITISGRLDKPGNIGKIAHDPNIGALSYIAFTLRRLGWKGEIEITRHNIDQENIHGNNKFLSICNMLDINMAGIAMPKEYAIEDSYWHYERKSEKIASIFFHIACECLGFKEVYQNHAGCERGYFKISDGKLIALPKYCGTDQRNLLIPDVIMRDDANRIVYLIEGKKLDTLRDGLKEIDLYDDIDKLYLRKYFPGYAVKRYLTIFGGNKAELPDEKVILYISGDGKLIMNTAKEPKLSARIMDLLK